MRTAIILFTLLAGLGTATAGKKAGVTMPDSVSVATKPLVLNGMGLREATWMKVDVYVAGLYLEKVSSDAAAIVSSEQTKQLVLKFVRDVDRDDIVKAWTDGFNGNATVPVAKIKPLIDQLNGWMPEFEEDDTLTFTYTPGQGVEVTVNKTRKGVIQGDDFARSLFAIWLGPKPPTSDLKRGLLGNHGAAR
ncbi:MAG: chalcone isomerase family protein [Myxococcales bacterium]|nr:chalcone isomerase family protein [Myxococcales bacterium]